MNLKEDNLNIKETKTAEQNSNSDTSCQLCFEAAASGKLYDLIYADPPWRYDFSESEETSIEKHYPTMTLEDIKNLDVPAAANSVLYLWTTAPKLIEGLEVMKAWGFTYKTQGVWIKEQIGLGYWFRVNHEILLIGTKGKFSPPPADKRVDSAYFSKRTKHSKKPQYYRDLLNRLFPSASKLEMFARPDDQDNLFGFDKFSGFDVWGNEVESKVCISAAEQT